MGAQAGTYDAVVVGGGFFGCALALSLEQQLGLRVIVLERGTDLFQRASYVNQARIHNGYHYPRSILTGLRSRVNFERFLTQYSDCVVDNFASYYAVGRHFSKVSAPQFALFCDRIAAPLEPAPPSIRRLFNPELIEDVFRTRECVFDALLLRKLTRRSLQERNIEVLLECEALQISHPSDGVTAVRCRDRNGTFVLRAARVYNCTYSRTNHLLVASGLPAVPLKQELTEMALVEPPEEFAEASITVMCGPFFSLMPFPARNLHSLSHVRYTPHCEWTERPGEPYTDPYLRLDSATKRSNYPHMVRDAQRYLPCMSSCRYVESIWETKTVLPQSEGDDSRPILFLEDTDLPGLTSVLGGKIDNVFDMLDFEMDSRRRRLEGGY